MSTTTLLISLLSLGVIPMANAAMDESSSEIVSSQQSESFNNSEVYIVIDINPAVQKMKVYMNGISAAKYVFPISSGRESFDFPTNFKHSPSCSVTPTEKVENGKVTTEFKPTRLHEMYYSTTWFTKNKDGEYTDGAPMGFSTFFNGGIAFHATSAAEVKRLGPKTDMRDGGSGGCIRMRPEDAGLLFDMVAICEKYDNRENCVKYAKNDPRNDKVCLDNPTLPKCADEKQWPVKKRKKNMIVKVIDTRSPADKQKAVDSCEAKKKRFYQDKATCMKERIEARPNYQSQESFDMKAELNLISKDDRTAYSMECNREIYVVYTAEDKAERERLLAAKQANSPQAGPSEAAPGNHLPPTQHAPVQELHAAAPPVIVEQPAAPQPKPEPIRRSAPASQEHEEGLWMNSFQGR